MSKVKIQGVDSIKFDDSMDTGVLSNLSMGKDVRKLSVRYAFFFQTVLPLVFATVFFIFGMLIKYFTAPFLMASLISVLIWRNKRARYLAREKGLFDEPKYLKYNKKAAEADFAPKEIIGDVKKAAPGVGKGVFFLGHEISTNQEIHAEDGKMRTHIIIFGTTGSGKTENILSLCVNFLTMASGFILVDGKGDTLLFAKTFSLCRAYGRTDDLYLLNFMDEGIASDIKRVERITNTFNFLVESTASEANEIIGGLLPSDGAGVWEGRAATGIVSLNQAMYYLKDNGYIEIDPDTYRSFFALDEFVALAMNETIPKEKRAGLWLILSSINYKAPSEADPNPKQNPATEEQFQYIVMQYTETFNMLADQYARITLSQVPDISITDIVLRRRILLVLLPSLAKSEQSVRNLGRIIIAMTRNVSSKAIGSNIEGDYAQTIESKPTAAINSFGLIFDEFGTYATKGASTLPAQLRSLNIVCIFAGQDYEAFQKGDEIEAATIFANCTIKIAMKLESILTYEKFNDSAGEKYIMVQESYETKETMFGRKYMPAESATITKRPVLDFKDLKEQSNGQQTLIYGSMVHRLSAFYADPIMSKKARLNHFIEIRRPPQPQVQLMRKGVDSSYRRLIKRMNGDWEAEETNLKNIILSFSTLNLGFVKTFDQVEESLRKENKPMPTEVEMVTFALSIYAKRIDLVDYNIKKSLKSIIGIEDNEEYEDEVLLGEGGSEIEGFRTKNQIKIDKKRTLPFEHLNSDTLKEETAELATSEKNEIEKDLNELGLSNEVFDRIEALISAKENRLKKAEKESFNSLDAINLSVFDTQQGIQLLEEAMLQKKGKSPSESKKISILSSKNMIVEMGMLTNPAIVSEPERKRKSPSRSAKEASKLINNLTKTME